MLAVTKSDGSVRFCTDYIGRWTVWRGKIPFPLFASTGLETTNILRSSICWKVIGRCPWKRVPEKSPRSWHLTAYAFLYQEFGYHFSKSTEPRNQRVGRRVPKHRWRACREQEVVRTPQTNTLLFDSCSDTRITVNLPKLEYCRETVFYLGHDIGQSRCQTCAGPGRSN